MKLNQFSKLFCLPVAQLGKHKEAQIMHTRRQTQLHRNISLEKLLQEEFQGTLLLLLVSGVSSVCLMSQHLFTRGEIVPEKPSKIKPENSLCVAIDNKERRKNEMDTETEGAGRRN